MVRLGSGSKTRSSPVVDRVAIDGGQNSSQALATCSSRTSERKVEPAASTCNNIVPEVITVVVTEGDLALDWLTLILCLHNLRPGITHVAVKMIITQIVVLLCHSLYNQVYQVCIRVMHAALHTVLLQTQLAAFHSKARKSRR